MSEVFEVVDYSSGEMYWSLGVFESLDAALAAIRAASHDKDTGNLPREFDPHGWLDSDAVLYVYRRSVGQWNAEPQRVAKVKVEVWLGECDTYLMSTHIEML